MIGYMFIVYIQILTYYKGLQSGNIAPATGLYGRGVGQFGRYLIFR